MQVCACSSPVWLPDKQLYVPCGHCDACLALKGFQRCNDLDVCLSYYPVRYLVTLTYNDEHLPIAAYNEESHSFVSDIDCDYNGECYSVSVSECSSPLDYDYVLNCLNRYGGLPVLSRKNIIDFKKRFRKFFHKYYPDEDVFIYLCGEYGPSTFRPHYHCIFGFKSMVSRDSLTSLLRASWSCRVVGTRNSRDPIGFFDVEYIASGTCGRYVSQYLNCTTHLPSLIGRGKFRPFHQSSRQCDLRQSYYGVRDAEFFSKPFFKVTYPSPRDSSPVVAPLPSFIQARFFPRHKAFDVLSSEGRVRVYDFVCSFVDFNHFYEHFKSPLAFDNTGFAYCFVNDVILHGLLPFQLRTVLYRFWCCFRRYGSVARRFGVSIVDYFRRLDLFYKDKALYLLNQFLSFVETFSLRHSVAETLSLYYNGTSSYFDYRNLTEYRNFHFLMSSIVKNTTKTKQRNDYFIRHRLQRPSFLNTTNVLRFKSKFL